MPKRSQGVGAVRSSPVSGERDGRPLGAKSVGEEMMEEEEEEEEGSGTHPK